MSEPMYEPSYARPPADRSMKVPHLVFGLLFLGIAGIWALGTTGAISGERLTVLAPVVLIAAGLIGLVASLAGNRNRRTDHPVGPAPEENRPAGTTEEIR